MESKNKKEIWKDINGYEGLYAISSFGRVKSHAKFIENTKNGTTFLKKYSKILMRYDTSKDGYHHVRLQHNGNINKYRVNRLVATAFIPNKHNKPQVNHIDGNKKNNHVSNLEWVTAKENSQHYVLNNPDDFISVTQLTLKGDFVRNFDNIKEAYRITNIHFTSICAVCRGDRHTAGGYLWKYKKPRQVKRRSGRI